MARVQARPAHQIVEAPDAEALTRGAQALVIRIARGLNKVLGRRGPVFADRYHARALRTPREVRNALCYVLQNYRRHATPEAIRRGGIDRPHLARSPLVRRGVRRLEGPARADRGRPAAACLPRDLLAPHARLAPARPAADR